MQFLEISYDIGTYVEDILMTLACCLPVSSSDGVFVVLVMCGDIPATAFQSNSTESQCLQTQQGEWYTDYTATGYRPPYEQPEQAV